MKNRSKIGYIKWFNFGDEQKKDEKTLVSRLSSLVFRLSSILESRYRCGIES